MLSQTHIGKEDLIINNVVFYEDIDGKSELYDEIIELTKKAETNKDIRIQIKQINYYINLLRNGVKLPQNIAKHISEEIWELRPGKNRILYFYFEKNTFVLLHMFRKKSKKTPISEIEKAKIECKDYIKRNKNIQK